MKSCFYDCWSIADFNRGNKEFHFLPAEQYCYTLALKCSLFFAFTPASPLGLGLYLPTVNLSRIRIFEFSDLLLIRRLLRDPLASRTGFLVCAALHCCLLLALLFQTFLLTMVARRGLPSNRKKFDESGQTRHQNVFTIKTYKNGSVWKGSNL